MRDTIRWDGTRPVVITDLHKTCIAHPAQWEGRCTSGDNVYIRYRSGWFRVDLWANDDGDGAVTIYETEESDGSEMEWQELCERLPEWIRPPLIEWDEGADR